MNEEERSSHLVALDDELLKGGVILSEWCSFIVREADVAFVKGAHLASIMTAVAGIETYLRSEYAHGKKSTFFHLIDESPIDNGLRTELHTLRKYRNKWVHVEEPWDDAELLSSPETFEAECEEMAFRAVRVLRKTIYENLWI